MALKEKIKFQLLVDPDDPETLILKPLVLHTAEAGTGLKPGSVYTVNIKDLEFEDDSVYSNKEEFITKYLTGHYENKLAFLRDNINIPDTKLLYLNYLLEAILKFDSSTDLSNVYFSEIVEQNYNGTFTDIICTIQIHLLPL